VGPRAFEFNVLTQDNDEIRDSANSGHDLVSQKLKFSHDVIVADPGKVQSADQMVHAKSVREPLNLSYTSLG
jgi:hypothetical protein